MSSYWNDTPIYLDVNDQTLIGDIVGTHYSCVHGFGFTITFREMTPKENQICKEFKRDIILKSVNVLPDYLANRVSEEIGKRFTYE